MTARRRLRALVLLAALVATACGVPTESPSRRVVDSDVPYALLSPAPGNTGPVVPPAPAVSTPGIYLLDGSGRLVEQRLPVDARGVEPVVRDLLAALVAGPTEAQRANGLGTALGPDVTLALLDVVDGTARVSVRPGDRDPAADRLPLAVGQIVLTVTSAAGVDSVLLVRDGEAVQAPLPGGELTATPLTAADYGVLVGDAATSTETATR